MRVTEARIDGNPAEVFSRESLPSDLLAGAEEKEFLWFRAARSIPANRISWKSITRAR